MKIYIYSCKNKTTVLLNTDLSFVEIAKQTNKSAKTIKRINEGETHYNSNYIYPIRH